MIDIDGERAPATRQTSADPAPEATAGAPQGPGRATRRWLSAASGVVVTLLSLLAAAWVWASLFAPAGEPPPLTVPFTVFQEQVRAGNVAAVSGRGDQPPRFRYLAPSGRWHRVKASRRRANGATGGHRKRPPSGDRRKTAPGDSPTLRAATGRVAEVAPASEGETPRVPPQGYDGG